MLHCFSKQQQSLLLRRNRKFTQKTFRSSPASHCSNRRIGLRQERSWQGNRSSHIAAARDSLSSLDSVSGSQDEESLQQILELQKEEQVEFQGKNVALYVGGAFAFGLGIWATLGSTKAEEYFAGYLLEQSLSVDNLFVFILVFNYFKTPAEAQSKVLTYGLLTAAVLRLFMIVVGAELVENFQPVLLAFAGVLAYSAYGLITKGDDDDDESDLSNNRIVKVCRNFMKVSEDYEGNNFFTVMDNGVKRATPLLLVLAVIEISDVVFAVDSIPAVFGVTTDPFILWTSNMWALLSLRSLYSFVAVAMGKLVYLDKAIALVLAWVSFKLVGEFFGLQISTPLSLGVVASTLGGGVGLSLLFPPPGEKPKD